MLEYLHVKNLALIEECEIDFTEGLNIFTGETGAGKSILLGSVNLCLGQRADKSMIRHGANEALIELAFRADERTKARLREMDIESDDDTVLILRKITPDKSIFKINGETCLVKQVKEIAECLIDIHGQHEHQSLLSNAKQRDMIDALGGEEISGKLQEVADIVKKLKHQKEELEELLDKSKDAKRNIELLAYECNEINNAGLSVGEDIELEEMYKVMKNAGRISEAVSEAMNLISSGSGEDASSFVSHAIHRMNQAVSLDENTNAMLAKLDEAEALLGDFALEASRYLDSISWDESKMNEVEDRLDLINSLKSRFGNTIEAILDEYEHKAEELENLQNVEENIKTLQKTYDDSVEIYNELCEELYELRKKYSKSFEEDIVKELLELNFAGVKFGVLINHTDALSYRGKDEVEFIISTNPGEEMKPLKNVASGGELSRIMLAIKTIMAVNDDIDSLIFDEIDAGISGKTAWEVSKKLKRLASKHQVIAITHLAQIAAMADTHFEIKKNVENEATRTNIHRLDDQGELEELARLLGSDNLSEAALSNAKELKDKAAKEKNF